MDETRKEFKVGQVWKRNDGLLVTILSTSAVGDYPIIGQLETHYNAEIHFYKLDGNQRYFIGRALLEEVKPKKKLDCYINVYTADRFMVHRNRSEADRGQSINRLACIHIVQEFSEGEGL